MKTCSKCNLPKGLSEFSRCSAAKDKLQVWCKACSAEYEQARWLRPESKEHARKLSATPKRKKSKRDYNLRVEYGITPNEFNALLLAQQGVCAICGGPGGKKGLGVDHDHETGKVRALLCSKCNGAIGFLNDSAKTALAAAEYLTLHGKP